MDSRRRPDPDRGPRRPLSPRAAEYAAERKVVDRGGRFTSRLEEVRETRERRLRRRARIEFAAWIAAAAVALGVGWALGGAPGAVVGASAWSVLVGLTVVLRGVARRRGASAWDWNAERHRLLGSPADRVHDPDADGILDRLNRGDDR